LRSLHQFLNSHRFAALLLILAGVSISGCAGRQPVAAAPPATAPNAAPPSETAKAPTPPPLPAPRPRSNPSAQIGTGWTEEGEASWYGGKFHGRQASNGEIYDMNKLTAAHRTLPFETMVRVTNQRNGKSTVVRITDRGPFVNNRIIDLSYAAAKEIESIGEGVVPVRLEVVSPGVDPDAGFFTIQIGAFHDQGNADRLRLRLGATYSPVTIEHFAVKDGTFYRVHVGRVSGMDATKELAEQLRSREGVIPIIIRLDEGRSASKE
jgi:rare lipoprotein A